MEERLETHLGRRFTKQERIHYYDYIENFISTNVIDWTKPPNTDSLAGVFAEDIRNLSNAEFIFLLLATGYIPEFYKHDSSQETLYTKLVEVAVCEWAKRVGFVDSSIQKQKASKEDVTIRIGGTVIVCDAKSYRLGRSQAAPNVKDTIKKADYDKWKDSYRGKTSSDGIAYNPIGGIITFPSLHRWKDNSDAYLYCTDANDPIALILYEQLAYLLIGDFDEDDVISFLLNYKEHFPKPTRDQQHYFETINCALFGEDNHEWIDFLKLTIEITNELVEHKLELINAHVKKATYIVQEEINNLAEEDIVELKRRLIESETAIITNQLQKQIVNIQKFRIKKGSKGKDEDSA